MTAAYDDITSPTKEFCTPEVEEELASPSREVGDPNGVYVVTVKTYATKTVRIKCNNDLSSFQLHFILNFILTEPKLACGLVKFPARLAISL